MQDECAWAIGNLAGGSAVCRDILRAKGAVDPLIALLKVLFELLFLPSGFHYLCHEFKVVMSDLRLDFESMVESTRFVFICILVSINPTKFHLFLGSEIATEINYIYHPELKLI